jgi:hypothetical protein
MRFVRTPKLTGLARLAHVLDARRIVVGASRQRGAHGRPLRIPPTDVRPGFQA